MNDRLTEQDYWNSNYAARGTLEPIAVDGAMNLWAARILTAMKPHVERVDSVLEIGGGGSPWLAYLAKAYPAKTFTALDYSPEGAALLTSYAEQHGLDNISVITEDFFESQAGVGEFGLAYSHGVVEHFQDLPNVLRAHARFIRPQGRLFTLIPNMHGSLGTLTKWMNRDVYDIHVPHDLASFVKGHRDAGLILEESDYLGSVNFGVLSSCFDSDVGFKRSVYRILLALSIAAWYFEDRIVDLPLSGLFSPYMYAVAKRQ